MSLYWSQIQFERLGYNPDQFKDLKSRPSGYNIHYSLNDQQSLLRSIRDQGFKQNIDEGLITLFQEKDPGYQMLLTSHDKNPIPEIPREK